SSNRPCIVVPALIAAAQYIPHTANRGDWVYAHYHGIMGAPDFKYEKDFTTFGLKFSVGCGPIL
ncbi:hypothetical protein, partial [Francisella tularensis]|uniref:hypothetical protein n=1 Tax=Francisella tularensis TaxID=263 RepID=UPI00311AB984